MTPRWASPQGIFLGVFLASNFPVQFSHTRQIAIRCPSSAISFWWNDNKVGLMWPFHKRVSAEPGEQHLSKAYWFEELFHASNAPVDWSELNWSWFRKLSTWNTDFLNRVKFEANLVTKYHDGVFVALYSANKLLGGIADDKKKNV